MKRKTFNIIMITLIPIIAGVDVVFFGKGIQTYSNYLIMCSFEFMIFYSGVLFGDSKIWENMN